jgi:hypothetical protein
VEHFRDTGGATLGAPKSPAMKVFLVKPKLKSGQIYYSMLDSLYYSITKTGVNASIINTDDLTKEADGYFFVADHLDHPVKIWALKNNKPTAWISGAIFPSLKETHVRVIFNGITPNWGTWKTTDMRIETTSVDKCPSKTVLIAPKNFHTNINLGLSMEKWTIDSSIKAMNTFGDREIVIRLHPKIKSKYAKQTNIGINIIKEFAKKNSLKVIQNSKIRDTSVVDYGIMYSHTSTASVEAFIEGKEVICTSPGNFMYNNPDLKTLRSCMWTPKESDRLWEANKKIFKEGETSFISGEFESHVYSYLQRLS